MKRHHNHMKTFKAFLLPAAVIGGIAGIVYAIRSKRPWLNISGVSGANVPVPEAAPEEVPVATTSASEDPAQGVT